MNVLPNPLTDAGEDLLHQYNLVSHGVFIAIWAALFVFCLVRFWKASPGPGRDKRTSPFRWLVARFRRYPLVAFLLLAYGIAIVATATWYYPEIVGWYADIDRGDLLENFRFVPAFVGETMKRNDFRFFPLAHQDLHVLSWFTPYVKVWAILNVAELVAVVVLVVRFMGLLLGRAVVGLPLLVTVLLLFHASVAESFFQFIYSERLLSVCLAVYAHSYLSWLRGRGKRYFYSGLGAALLGIFLKDIAFLLFVVPAVVVAIPVLLKEGLRGWKRLRFESGIALLMIGYLIAYLLLSALPSIYAGQQSYAAEEVSLFEPGLRFWFLVLFMALRALFVGSRRSQLTLLDGLNVGALLYALALYVLVGFSGRSYLALPVQLITVMDAAYVYGLVVVHRLSSPAPPAFLLPGVVLLSGLGLGLVEHQRQADGWSAARQVVRRQQAWRQALWKLGKLATETRRDGKPVNIIFSTTSWFHQGRHLDRLPFDRLIRLDPGTGLYQVVEGVEQDQPYETRPGDFLIDLDGTLETTSGDQDRVMFLGVCLQPVYRYDAQEADGRIFTVLQSSSCVVED